MVAGDFAAVLQLAHTVGTPLEGKCWTEAVACGVCGVFPTGLLLCLGGFCELLCLPNKLDGTCGRLGREGGVVLSRVGFGGVLFRCSARGAVLWP
jgi:hypothetical protein